MGNVAWRNLVASCTALVAALTFAGEHGDGLPHVHPTETDAAATFTMLSNMSPAASGAWYH